MSSLVNGNSMDLRGLSLAVIAWLRNRVYCSLDDPFRLSMKSTNNNSGLSVCVLPTI